MLNNRRKRASFFERLTGAVPVEEDHLEEYSPSITNVRGREIPIRREGTQSLVSDEPEDAQLTIDMFQTPDSIILKAMVAGVRPEELQVTITRDTITIKGHREEDKTIVDDDYYFSELYWGGFSRTVLLPEEVDPESAEATQRHGLLTIRMPKIDKKKKQQLRVKAG
jgi:HSP20 family protein